MKTNQSIKLQQIAVLALSLFGAATLAVGDEPPSLWTIGAPDGAAAEFAPGARPELSFTVGQSVVSKDFAGFHEGSVAWDGKVKEKPYTIRFDLAEPPQGDYELVLDLIYSAGAPAQIKIGVNGKPGIFPVRPAAKRSTWGEEGNEMLMAKQRLVVPLAGAWLRAKDNQLSITPLGMGGMGYDAISFRRATGAASRSPSLEPTIFFRKRGGKLAEVCDLLVPFTKRFDRATATVKLGKQSFSATLTNALYDFGLWREPVEIPAASVTGQADIQVMLGGETLSGANAVAPAKQWKVFVCPKVHNDVGYTDLQPHVNELDNRNTDTVLDILAKYPFYKFNFETSWLVDNYMDCRTQPQRDRFLDYLRHKRISINALYLNLMTGICTGEELYRAMYYTQRVAPRARRQLRLRLPHRRPLAQLVSADACSRMPA